MLREKGQRSPFKNPSCLSLSLPRVTWQQLLIGLAGENQRLRQQSEQANSETGATILASGKSDRPLIRQSKKQPTRPCVRKPQIIFQVCPGCENVSERKSTVYVHQSRCQNRGDNSSSAPLDENCPNQSAGHAVKQTSTGQRNVSRRSSPEPHSSGKIERLTQTIASASQTETLFSARMLLFSNIASQTEPILESRGVNTKLKSRQIKSTPSMPYTQQARKSRRGNNSTLKLVTSTDDCISTQSLSLPAAEEISPVVKTEQRSDCEKESKVIQEIPVSQESKPLVIKVPQDSDQLLLYTQQKIEQLVYENEISKPETLKNLCLFCKRQHNMTECERRREISESNTTKKCSICANENHPLIDCPWVPILDCLNSLSSHHQKKVLEWCPFLQKFVDDPKESIIYSLTSLTLTIEIQTMDKTKFSFPYFKKSQAKCQDLEAETRKNTEVAKPTRAENTKVVKTTACQGERLCFYCHQNHLVRNCVLFKEKKERRKGSNSLKTSPNQQTIQRHVIRAERFTKEQYFLSRSSTAGNLSTEERWKRYLRFSDRIDQRQSLPENSEQPAGEKFQLTK
ncbi:hypothetical protein BsWGS_19929 [Bradybaena similaris]